MANIYPNSNAYQFCTWILSNSLNRPTTARKVQIQTVQSAALAGTSVAQLYYEEFVQYTNQWYDQYLQFLAMQPNIQLPASLDALTTTWLTYVTTPSNATVYAVDAFFKQLRADGNLLLDYFFLFAQDSQANGRISLINPNLYAVTEHGTPTWNAYQGYTGNGSSMYLSTNYTESTNAIQWQLNNNTSGLYARLSTGFGTITEMGAYDGVNNSSIKLRTSATASTISNDSTAIVTSNNIGSQGLYMGNRKNNTQVTLTINGITSANITSNSSALVAKNDFILALNNNGTPAQYSSNQIAIAFKGNGAINLITMNSAVNLLATNLGAHY